MIPHEKWALSQRGFDRLLDRLGPDRERAGERYEALRFKLIKFFEWRGSPFPEGDTDEATPGALRAPNSIREAVAKRFADITVAFRPLDRPATRRCPIRARRRDGVRRALAAETCPLSSSGRSW